VRFDVWAPDAASVEVEAAGRRHAMAPSLRRGWWTAEAQGEDYGFLIDGEGPFPDPRSPWQPDGVHGLSRVYDHGRFTWTDGGWRGRPLAGGILYELHTGTFTPEGTFDSAIERLGHLADLGVNTVELMPVAAFPGRHGWGYDGVGLWAVHDPYGGPDGLKRFVDACHGRGLAVVLDVVYNHLGPSGNYLGHYGPYFTDAHRTPWGPAVNLDRAGSDEVRAFIVENALMWLRDYHLDGLRLDAVHAMQDGRAVHILEELAVAVEGLRAATGREMFLIAESDLGDPRLVTSREAGGYGLEAQWNDDFHHAVHAALTGERQGYYGDFGSMGALAKTMTRAFFHDGTWSSFRGRSHGRPVDPLRTPGHRFTGFIQNHDQVGNRATGDRISATLSTGLLKVGAGLLLTSPFTPMLFMGEEWGAGTPWQFFTDHIEPELARAVSEGRRREFASHGWASEDVPDPQDPRTYRRSMLDWGELDRYPHRELFAWYRALIALRRSCPELTDARLTEVSAEHGEAWIVVYRGSVRIAANLGTEPVRLPDGELLLASADGVHPGGELPGESLAVLRMERPPEGVG
jgi:malto-oligosyltrehalose trehalohydrolase